MSPGVLRDLIRGREAILIEQENAMFQAARDHATTNDERGCGDEFIAHRAENLKVHSSRRSTT